MKILLLLSLFTLVSCNGAGGSGGQDPEVSDPNGGIADGTCLDQANNVISCTTTNSPLQIEYNSHGAYQNNGISLDLMGTYDQQRAIVIPQFIDLLQDTSSSVQNFDTVRIIFVTTTCDWKWSGTQFEFFACSGLLNGADYGDTIYLHDLHNAMNAQMDGKIQMGVVRNPAMNHTGTIRVKANLQ